MLRPDSTREREGLGEREREERERGEREGDIGINFITFFLIFHVSWTFVRMPILPVVYQPL